jgi:hypothetical protein
MKHRLHHAMLVVLIAATGCNKGSVNQNNGNGTGNGNGNGGGTASLSVTGFTPLRPYLDDTLIINGTGFNSDKSKDTVLFNFSLGKIISATSTQLKVTMPAESDINMTFLYTSKLEVRANGKKFPVTNGIGFKRPLQLYGLNDPETNISIGKPDDSLVFNGSGFNVNGNGMAVSIGTTSVPGYNIDSNFHGTVSLRLPKGFFGSSNDEAAVEQKQVTIKNADGRIVSKTLNFYLSPRMRISSAQFEQNDYHLANGAVVILNIIGRNLKNDTKVELSGPNNYHAISSLPVSGFPSTASVSFGPNFPSVGNYSVELSRNGFTYAIASFRILN